MTRKRRLFVLVWSFVLAGCMLVAYEGWRAHDIGWRRVRTQDQFGVICSEFSRGLPSDLAKLTPQAAEGIAVHMYMNRMGRPPIDGWGHRIRITATVKDNVCELHLASPGRDGIWRTADDVTRTMTYH